jgi:hypothetical protein
MSLVVKKTTGGEYVYFQTYHEGKKKEEFVGRADDPEAWNVVWILYLKESEGQRTALAKRIEHEMNRRRLGIKSLPLSYEEAAAGLRKAISTPREAAKESPKPSSMPVRKPRKDTKLEKLLNQIFIEAAE